eukprot:g9636.t1
MVRVEEKESSHDSFPPGAEEVSPPPPPAAPSAILSQCLKLLRGQSDEHKFAGLVMVTKHVPALTASKDGSNDSNSSSAPPSGGGQLGQICSAVGPAFVHRLLRTPGDQSGGGGDASVAGLSLYQQIALGVLAAFFRDENLVQKFLPVAPALVRALRAADATTQTQSLCDALYCVQSLAGVPDGMKRLLRAGAAPAVVSRLSAESGDRKAAAAEKREAKANEAAPSGGRVDETKTGGGVEEAKQAAAPAAAAVAAAPAPASACSRFSSPNGLGGGRSDESAKDGGGDGPAERAEALAFAFVGRALEASGGNCLGPRELTAVAEAFRDDPTPAKFGFMDLLLRWASLQEEGDEAGVAAWTRTGPFPPALREGLLQALHGAAADERRDSALALLASLLRAVGQEWAVETEEGATEAVGGRGGSSVAAGGGTGRANGVKKNQERAAAAAATRRRKRGTFVAFAVRCAAGEVRILLDEALSLFVPAAARGGASTARGDGDDEAGPGTGQGARGAMGPVGADPSIGLAAEIAGANAATAAAKAAATAAAAAGDDGERKDDGEGDAEPPAPRAPLSAAELKAMKEQRTARLLRMVPVALGVAESTIAFLCGGEGATEDDGEGGEEEGGKGSGRWDQLPINTLQDLQKTLVGLFGCVLDFFSEIRRWIVVAPAPPYAGDVSVRAEQDAVAESSPSRPSIVDLWGMQRLGLECSRVLGVWVAEDPESLPQKFLEVLPVLLALDAGAEGVVARLARLAAAGAPAIAALLGPATGAHASTSLLAPPPEQISESVRSPLITACGLLTNILTSAGHLAWPEKSGGAPPRRRVGGAGQQPARAPSHPVLGHPRMGECLASLAEVAGAAGAARRAGGGTRWRLLAAHATLVVLTVARAATPANGLAPARGLLDRRVRWVDEEGSDVAGVGSRRRPPSSAAAMTVWEGMARAVDEALGSLSAVPGRGLIGGGGGADGAGEDEEAGYEEGTIWQWCLECAREMEAASGGAAANPYVSSGVVPRRMLRSLIEASSDGRI